MFIIHAKTSNSKCERHCITQMWWPKILSFTRMNKWVVFSHALNLSKWCILECNGVSCVRNVSLHQSLHSYSDTDLSWPVHKFSFICCNRSKGKGKGKNTESPLKSEKEKVCAWQKILARVCKSFLDLKCLCIHTFRPTFIRAV